MVSLGVTASAASAAILLAVLPTAPREELFRSLYEFSNLCEVIPCTGGPYVADYTGTVLLRSSKLTIVDRFVFPSSPRPDETAPLPDGWRHERVRGRWTIVRKRDVAVKSPLFGSEIVEISVPDVLIDYAYVVADKGRFRISGPSGAIARTAPPGARAGLGPNAPLEVPLGETNDETEPPSMQMELRGRLLRNSVSRWIADVNWAGGLQFVFATILAGLLTPVTSWILTSLRTQTGRIRRRLGA